MSEIFISYARSTEAQARQVEEGLRALGYDVWRDDELPAHRAYTDVIEERLRASKAVVVLWSSDAVKSQWVQSEADHARASVRAIALKDRLNSTDAIGALLNLGDLDGAFLVADFFTRPENLSRSWSMQPFDVQMLFRPVAAAMWRDPRFPPLMGRLGLWDYWRRSGHWPDFCSEPGLPYDCKSEASRSAQ